MRGRKPLPTALHRLHGNPSEKRLNKREPVPSGALDQPPDWMTAEQAAGWRYVLACAPPGLLRRLDRGVLAVWVMAEDLHRRAAVALQGEAGLLGEDGKASPYLHIAYKQAQVLVRAASELGFSPSARGRVFATGNLQAPAPARRDVGGRRVVSLAEYVANAPPRPKAE